MKERHLAELNIARLIAPTDDPRVAEFMDNLDRINGLGKKSPGFVWIMEGSSGPGTGNTDNNIGDDPQMVANLTVWEDIASLKAFVFKTLHKQFFRRRHDWFERADETNFVMWWVSAGHIPTLEEGLEKLNHLREHGDTDAAFGWKHLDSHDQ